VRAFIINHNSHIFKPKSKKKMFSTNIHMSVSTSNKYDTTCPDCHGSGDKLILPQLSSSLESSSQSSFIGNCDTCFGTGDLYIASQVICNCHPCLDRTVYEFLKDHSPTYKKSQDSEYISIDTDTINTTADTTDTINTTADTTTHTLCHTS